MGVYTYWLVVAIVILLGLVMPQSGKRKKQYIILMTAVHIFICGFRYMYLTGDLRKYAWNYYQLPGYSWFSDYAWLGGRNTGFQWLLKGISMLSGGDFQILLILLAVVTQVLLAVLIYKHSPKPWLSFLVWNCMSFYITYDFSAIKQGLAMALLMLAMDQILENRPKSFLLVTLLAGFVHTPALCFLPAYFLMKRRVTTRLIALYAVAVVAIFFLRNQIVAMGQDLYYGDNEEVNFVLQNESLGGRFFVIVLLLLVGYLLKGFWERDFEGLFNIIAVAAIFQMFSGYDNVFTRLSDYYLQFLVLYIPMIFYERDHTVQIHQHGAKAFLPFDKKSVKLIVAGLTVVLIWWYWRTNLGATIAYEADNYLSYRFMWEVK